MGDSSEKDCSCRRLFELGDSKETAIVAKHIGLVRDELGEDPRFIVVCLPNVILRAIEENILLYRVTVQIKKHY